MSKISSKQRYVQLQEWLASRGKSTKGTQRRNQQPRKRTNR